MKANNLHGEYCQTCAAILDDVQRNHRRVIVLDSQCAAVYHQSGDAARMDEQANLKGVVPHPKLETQSEPEPEPVHKKSEHKAPAKPAHKPAKASRR